MPNLRSLLFALLLTGPLAAQDTSPSADRKDEVDPAKKYAIDGSQEWYLRIRDNAVLPWFVKKRELGEDTDLLMEEFAYDDALIHAAKFPHAELEAAARRDVLFGSLCNESRLDYKLELIRIEGRLKRLVPAKVTEGLKNQNVTEIYEAWVFPANETTPLCFIFSELPPGLECQKDLGKDDLNKPVAVTGYYFKLLKYEQTALVRSDPTRHKVWAAPLLIGRSLTVLPTDALVDSSLAWRTTFIPFLVGGFTLLALTLVCFHGAIAATTGSKWSGPVKSGTKIPLRMSKPRLD